MKNRYAQAFLSSLLSIGPMIAIVLILTLILRLLSPEKTWPLSWYDIALLLFGLVVLVCGLALFQIGATTGLTKVGEYMGQSLSKQKKLFVVILFAFALGALITCAEPSILIVSKQVTIVNNQFLNALLLIGSIAIGVGIFVVIGILRVIFHKSLKFWYFIFYVITFLIITLIAIFPETRAFLPFVFDSGGITTGSATVPFILALGAGVAAVCGGRNSHNDSFGLVGMASIGPIMTMAIMILIKYFTRTGLNEYVFIENGNLTSFGDVGFAFLNSLLPHINNGSLVLGSSIEVLIALAPILIIFLIYNFIFIKLPKKAIAKLLIGFIFSYIGLALFLSATGAAMSPVGQKIGLVLGNQNHAFIVLVCFIIGLVTILCEPAVHVLTEQIVQISDGHVRKIFVILALSIGTGLAICLAAIRAIYGFSILYYVIPGYAIVLLMMLFTPTIYTAMAFDSGGTASGPMSTSFVLPLIIGITKTVNENKGLDISKIPFYEDAFGVVALIALTPVIAIQFLGIIENISTKRRIALYNKIDTSIDDAQIIHF